MDDDVIRPILDLLAISLGIPTALIHELPQAVQQALLQALDESATGIGRAEVDGHLYLAHRGASPSIPLLVVGPYPVPTAPDDADGSTRASLDRIEAALQATAAIVKQASGERQRRLELRRLQTIIDQLPEAIIVAHRDPDRVVLANHQVGALLGWEIQPPLCLDDFARRNQRFTVAGTPLELDEFPLTRALRHGESVARHEFQIARPDGTQARLLVNASPLYDEDGRIIAAVTVFQDVAQLIAAEQLRDDFLALASHELRTPLTAIHGSTYLLLHDADRLSDETRRELLTDVVDASRRLGDLVENMAQVTTIRAGQVVIQRELVAVRPLIEDAVDAVVRSGPPRPVTVDVAPGLVALGDPQRLDQVLRNLLYNALKYSPEGSPIEITAAPKDLMVVISVRDHGPGFPPELREHAFERFPGARANSLTSESGLGLGLYLAQQFVEAQGGQIWIEHPDTGGALLRFTVPQAHDSPHP